MQIEKVFTTLLPGSELNTTVQSIWDCTSFTSNYTSELRLPSGCMEVVFNLTDQPMRYRATAENSWHTARYGVISGPHSKPFILDTSQALAVLGMNLSVSKGRQLLPCSPSEFFNTHASVEEVWGSAACEQWERLRELRSAARRLQNACGWARQLLTCAPEPHWAVVPALRMLAEEDATVSGVGRRIGLSDKRLREVLRVGTGWSPKPYARLCRFRTALNLLSMSRIRAGVDEPVLSRLALRCGYFDQAHLTREFRAFAGITPGVYLRRCTFHPNHVGL